MERHRHRRRSSSRRAACTARSPTRRTRSSRRAEYDDARDGSVLARRRADLSRRSARRCGSPTPSTSTICSCCPFGCSRENPTELGDVPAHASSTSSSTSTRTRTARSTSSSSCSPATHGNVCVVGDDDQSIYGWRGADIRNILDFEKDFPAAHVVRLEENYRSHRRDPRPRERRHQRQHAGAWGRRCAPTRSGGERVTAAARLDERDEADFVVEELVARRAQSSIARRSATSRCSIARTRRAARSRRRCAASAIPYRLVGSVRFYDRREIRDLMATSSSSPIPPTTRRFVARSPCRSAASATRRSSSSPTRRASAGVPLLAAAARARSASTALRPAARTALARVRRAHRAIPRAGRGGRRRRAAARARRGDPLRRLPRGRRARVGRAHRERARADHRRGRDGRRRGGRGRPHAARSFPPARDARRRASTRSAPTPTR